MNNRAMYNTRDTSRDDEAVEGWSGEETVNEHEVSGGCSVPLPSTSCHLIRAQGIIGSSSENALAGYESKKKCSGVKQQNQFTQQVATLHTRESVRDEFSKEKSQDLRRFVDDDTYKTENSIVKDESIPFESSGNCAPVEERSEEQSACGDGKQNPTSLQGISSFHDHDVLCGKGKGFKSHVGNKKYRNLVSSNKMLYVSSKQYEKLRLAESIVAAIQSQDPPGRFLEKDVTRGLWIEIEHEKALEKTRQALREGAPKLRGPKTLEIKSSEPAVSESHFDMTLKSLVSHQSKPPSNKWEHAMHNLTEVAGELPEVERVFHLPRRHSVATVSADQIRGLDHHVTYEAEEDFQMEPRMGRSWQSSDSCDQELHLGSYGANFTSASMSIQPTLMKAPRRHSTNTVSNKQAEFTRKRPSLGFTENSEVAVKRVSLRQTTKEENNSKTLMLPHEVACRGHKSGQAHIRSYGTTSRSEHGDTEPWNAQCNYGITQSGRPNSEGVVEMSADEDMRRYQNTTQSIAVTERLERSYDDSAQMHDSCEPQSFTGSPDSDDGTKWSDTFNVSPELPSSSFVSPSSKINGSLLDLEQELSEVLGRDGIMLLGNLGEM